MGVSLSYLSSFPGPAHRATADANPPATAIHRAPLLLAVQSRATSQATMAAHGHAKIKSHRTSCLIATMTATTMPTTRARKSPTSGASAAARHRLTSLASSIPQTPPTPTPWRQVRESRSGNVWSPFTTRGKGGNWVRSGPFRFGGGCYIIAEESTISAVGISCRVHPSLT